MTTDPAMPANKAERLALAGAVAPSLRENAARARARRVARVASDGSIVGYATLADVQEKILERAKIELAVEEGTAPEMVPCAKCGTPTRLLRKNRRAPKKQRCRRCTFLRCADCRKALPRNYSSPSMIAKRRGAPARCGSCAAQARAATTEVPKCDGCGKNLSNRQAWQHFVKLKSTAPLRCRACSEAARRAISEANRPRCARCGEVLRSARPCRARGGKAPMCWRCYRGDVRREIALAKMEADPTFAAKARAALDKGKAIMAQRIASGDLSHLRGSIAARRAAATKYEANGECRSLTEWAESTGISKSTLSCRISRGMTMEEAVRRGPGHTGRPSRRKKL